MPNQFKMLNEEEEFLAVMQLAGGSALPMVMRAAIELDLFEIMAKAGPGAQLSAAEIASQLPTQNPQAPVMLDRMLRFLTSHSILKATLITHETGHNSKRLYGLTPISKYLVRNEHGVSIASTFLLLQDKVVVDCWYHLKEAVIEGGIPFNKAFGMHAFEYPRKDSRFNEVFNRAMYDHSSITMNKILEAYKGFEGVKEVVDVGGGHGATIASIISKYHNIRGINFDLPHVIKDAPSRPGVEHVGGDMFDSVPKGEVIFMKYILHDWSDEHCLKLLKNCWNALPESGGKVIVIESVLTEQPESDLMSKSVARSDMFMMAVNPGGKERTEKEFGALAREAGFTAPELTCRVYSNWVIEFYKNV